MKLCRAIYFIFLGIWILITTGCKKDSGNNTPSFKLSPHALEYVMIPEGKYFIYRDSATSRLDSVVVIQSSLQNGFYPSTPAVSINDLGTPAHYEESFHLLLSKFSGAAGTRWLYGAAQAEYNYGSDTCAVDLKDEDLFTIFYKWESDMNDIAVMVEGTLYNNVSMHTTFTYATDINDPAYKKEIYYWAKGVGVIKRTIIVTGGIETTSTLLRHN